MYEDLFSAPSMIIESFSPTSASSVILKVSENCATSMAYFTTVLFCAKAPVDKNTIKKPSRTKAKRSLRILTRKRRCWAAIVHILDCDCCGHFFLIYRQDYFDNYYPSFYR